MNAKEFLEQFFKGAAGKFMCIAIGAVRPNTTVYISSPDDLPDLPVDQNVFFGPALRLRPGDEKGDVAGTVVLWVDVDNPRTPLYTLPPSASVFSGKGWHLYWFLNAPVSPEEAERLNKILVQDIPEADPSCFNANRVLRIPGSVNTKYDPPVAVELKQYTGLVYAAQDIERLSRLDGAARHKIRTGDERGYRTRSERDWAIVMALVKAGFKDEIIRTLFTIHPCGNKYRDDGEAYLQHTLEKARETLGNTAGTADVSASGFDERSDGYYMVNQKGSRRVSTFTIEPTLLLDGSLFEAGDAVVGNVRAGQYTWPDVTLSRHAFTSVSNLDKECPLAAWQWLGSDNDVRRLLPHLLDKLLVKGLPKVTAAPTLGLHFLGGVPYFVGDSQTLSAERMWPGYEAPIAWLPTKHEKPQLDLTIEPSAEDLARVRELLPQLNTPEAIWPMIGWYAAAPVKTWLEARGYRFPILNVAGTKGSGKTTLIQRVFMPLFGQVDPKPYDSNTTRFVVLTILGSSNAVPVAFSEFRYEATERFLRFVLLSYDTGHDPRGRSDQSTVDYPLLTPFSIDGEDMIEDPAARERIVVVKLHPGEVAENTAYYQAFHDLRAQLPNLGRFYLQALLQRMQSGELDALLEQAREALFASFTVPLPERVRNNHIVAYFGILTWCAITGTALPEPDVLTTSVTSVYNLIAGRSRTLADALLEDIINECALGSAPFKWTTANEGSTFYFQLSSAHNWWMIARRRQGRGVLERDAVRSQLEELSYVSPPEAIGDSLMYGVSLTQARESGLDIPARIRSNEFHIRF